MCGICGFLGDPSGIDRAAMLQAISHRGPDDEGTYEEQLPDGVLWFGHQRLAIQDPSPTGHQPMSTPDGTLTITYNGEIYNFQEVRSQLKARGYHFQSTSDVEVILYAWQTWGSAALERFRGMFAFALWDRRDGCLWLVRDRMGEKPLYYICQPGRILFASEVRALLASGVVERRMDSDGLDAYLTFGSVADPYTLVNGVRALEAGHLARFQDGHLVSRRYWSLSDIPEGSLSVPRQIAVEKTGALLRESCDLCMVSDVPVGVLLSGGIDSSSIVVLLTELGHQPISTFSVVFEGSDMAFSEERWSSMVAERFKTHHNAVVVTEDKARSWVPDAVQAMDQPSRDGVNTYLVSRAIRSAGIKVAITGQGSDELFLGYWQRRLFPMLLRLAQLPLGWLAPLGRLITRWSPLHDTQYEKLLQTVGPDNSLAAAYLAQHSIYSQRGIERLRGGKRPPQTRFVKEQGGTTPLGKLSRLEMANYLCNTLMRDGDQMSMAHGLELRAPFVDYRLVETVSATQASMRVEPRRQKPLLIDAVRPGLPAGIAERPKQGFCLPYDRWLRAGLLVADVLTVEMGLNKSAVNKVKLRFERGQHWSRYWTLQVLAAWVLRERMHPPKDAAG